MFPRFLLLWLESRRTEEHLRNTSKSTQWWKRRRLVCTRVIPCSLQAFMTTSSAAEPAGAAMYSTPLCTCTDRRKLTRCLENLLHFRMGYIKKAILVQLPKSAFKLPVWHDRCCLWRERRHQSWQPQTAETWSRSSFQQQTEAQAPPQTWTSKLPNPDPADRIYVLTEDEFTDRWLQKPNQNPVHLFARRPLMWAMLDWCQHAELCTFRPLTSPMVSLTYWSIALAISALFTPVRNFMFRTQGWCLSHQLSALSPASRVQWIRDCWPAPIPITCSSTHQQWGNAI